MSSIKLPHASGNSMSIAAPATNPASDLELKLPATIGTAGQFLTVDGSGNLVWADPPGITMVDSYRNNTSVTGNQDPLGNFERSDDATSGFIGTGMTYSSGIFTFPETGIYLCEFQLSCFLSGDEREIMARIYASSDSGSNYDEVANSRMHIKQTESTNTHSCCIASTTVDVTNASNFRVKARVDTGGSTVYTNGNSIADETYFRFIRLGAT